MSSVDKKLTVKQQSDLFFVSHYSLNNRFYLSYNTPADTPAVGRLPDSSPPQVFPFAAVLKVNELQFELLDR